MPVRRSCSFCGNDIEPGTGKMFIRKDGTIYLFCSSKCQRNLLNLGRIPRWTPWTQAYRRATAVAAAEEAVPEVVVEASAPAGASVDVVVETPKGRDIPSDLVDLIDKKLGPDLSRGDVEKHYSEYVGSETFRHSIVSWARKARPGKPITHIERAEFLAYKDSPEGRRVFKAWLDGQWAKVKGRKGKGEEAEEAPSPAPAKKKKKGA
jgi:large subunit ribosomal protein L24e